MNKTHTTAYALNELHGSERDVFERDLAADADLQHELQSTSRVANGLEQIMVEPSEGLDPQARERLIRAIAENQRTFQQRRKIVRFAVPISLAAAASIAVLLLVAGGKTTQEPAMAAAENPPNSQVETGSQDPQVVNANVNGDLSGRFTANMKSIPIVPTISVAGESSSNATIQVFRVAGKSGSIAEEATPPLRGIRIRGLRLETLGLRAQSAPNGTEVFSQ